MIMLALVLVAVFATGVVAEDRLKISGAYRARGWYKDNQSNYDDGNDADRQQYFDQRFRVAWTIAVAEGITANLRTDFGEVQWGQQTTGSRGWARPLGSAVDSDRSFQLDRSYVRIDKEMFTLSVGQQYWALGNAIVVDDNQFGAHLRIKLPVDIYLQYAKISEGGSLNDESEFGFEDTDYFGGQAVYSQEGWSAGLLGGMVNDNSVTDNSPWVIGVFGDAAFGALSLKAEADFFGGDAGGNVDAVGTQVWGTAKYAVTPALWVAVDGWYAQGTDDPTEMQITGIGDSDSFSLGDRGPFNTDIIPLGGIAGAVGGAASNINEFDPAGASAGAIGGMISAGYRIIEPLSVNGSLMYISTEESSNTTLNNVFLGNLFLTYDWLENTEVAAGWVYTSIDVDGCSTDFFNVAVMWLQLKF
jgi:hypothetical protein